jgi:putative endonuclease
MMHRNSRTYYVYLLTNWNNQVMYLGVTNDLERRVYEHQNKLVEGFTKRYNVSKLVYYEMTTDVESALTREKEIKKWRREKKNRLVNELNPEWRDLSQDFSLRSK